MHFSDRYVLKKIEYLNVLILILIQPFYTWSPIYGVLTRHDQFKPPISGFRFKTDIKQLYTTNGSRTKDQGG